MSWFGEYIQPLTTWLQQNPSWALFITFSIALAESLAIIGSIVPGSVTMTTIGILAGSGIMRIDFTLVASTLGAVCGDSLSYALGYVYSDKLIDVWPFKKYPRLLNYGQEFFSRHGGKSVLIGRFVGPLRSIIPVIAGIMHMKQWRFLIANVISAVGWSLLYIMPGVLIGVAGHELSPESATRLFILILVLLIVIWLLSLLIKWLFLHAQAFLKNNLHVFWCSLKSNLLGRKIHWAVTPAYEKNHYPTVVLVLFSLLNLIALIIFCSLAITRHTKNIDVPVSLFFQSFHTHLLQITFIVCTEFTSTLTLSIVYLFCCFWFWLQKDITSIVYLSLLIITSTLLAYFLHINILQTRPEGLVVTMSGSSFPNMNLLVATALYGFILYFITNQYALLTATIKLLLTTLLILSGFGSVYLSDYWISDILTAYFAGLFIALSFYLFYRKEETKRKPLPTITLYLLIACIFLSSITSLYFNYTFLIYAHTPSNKEYILDSNAWWNQKEPILPLYRMNRVGKTTNLLNIQYSGDLRLLENELIKQGWKTQENESILKKIALRMSSSSNRAKLPILSQLYENKRPKLVMTYQTQPTETAVQLMIWDSNYNLHQNKKPVWIGTVYIPTNIHSYLKSSVTAPPALNFIHLSNKHFEIKKLIVPANEIKPSVYQNEPYILLIRPTLSTEKDK